MPEPPFIYMHSLRHNDIILIWIDRPKAAQTRMFRPLDAPFPEKENAARKGDGHGF
jgi:hypothetical protein